VKCAYIFNLFRVLGNRVPLSGPRAFGKEKRGCELAEDGGVGLQTAKIGLLIGCRDRMAGVRR
jgi:hypothetical protein